MIKITSLGGSGEDSRNCFLIRTDSLSVLLDCGVRREIADVSAVYPLLTKEIAQNLDAVLISHAHEDHTAALPYLYELGYHGPVYASSETIGMIPSYLKKWIAYVRQNGGSLPFDEANIEKLQFRPVDEFPLRISFGRDGHIVGGLWYLLEIEGYRLLYTGDLTYDSLLLAADPLPEADILIIDSAYAGRHLDQLAQYEKLADIARLVTCSGGKLLLPVPVNGRGIDMFVYLSRCGLPLYAESSIVKNTADLAEQKKWCKGFRIPEEKEYTGVTAANRAEVLGGDHCGVYLFGDGMMTGAVSADYFASVRDDCRSRILISGHSAKGTLANQLLSEDFRSRNGIRVSAERLTVKVHNDFDDVLALAEKVCPRYVVLFHSKKADCGALEEKLTAKGISVLCNVGRTLEAGRL